MIDRVRRVAQREYLAYVRTKTFVISVLILPVVFALAFGLPALLASLPKPPKAFTIVDETGQYALPLLARLRADAVGASHVLRTDMRDHIYVAPDTLAGPGDLAARMHALDKLALENRLFAFLVIQRDDPTAAPTADFYTTDVSATGLRGLLSSRLNEVITSSELRPFVADTSWLARTLAGVTVHTHAITRQGEEVATATHMARSFAPLIFVYLLWITILTMASHLMTSTIEEKSSRIVEVILSSISSVEFLSGKLIGLAGAGLTMIACWALAGSLIAGAIPNETSHSILMGVTSAFGGATILWFFGFFVLGFFFYAALHIGIGSVCNTLREAQTLMQPVMIVMMLPLFLMLYVTTNPDHIVSVIISLIPPFTPFVMMNRITANPPAPLWQIVLAGGLMIAATWATIRGAAKIFRLGILMYGKPPTLPEIMRWARQKQ